ncbi:MAG: aminoacyl-histidine dipeptidase [Clostridiales bacterium]|nr:aminoacyl-histidine dipeptidase [Clostridiales bacterium]
MMNKENRGDTDVLKGYYPENVFSYFQTIASIPHISGNEKEIADYIEKVANEHGLYCEQDPFHNVLVRKKPAPGCENMPALLLQGHLDMVGEKTADSSHDFLKDSLRLVVREGFLSAEDTTLGADDGIAVAMMLAVLTDSSLRHGPLECLFTVDEESGMTGAMQFDYAKIQAKRVINLDSEEEGTCIVSCAGGADIMYHFPYETAHSPYKCARIKVSGLAGGHSGADIHLARGNANRILARFLYQQYQNQPFNLVSFDGGDKHNVITGESCAVITCADFEKLKKEATQFKKQVAGELSKEDAAFTFRLDFIGARERVLSYRQTHRVLLCMFMAPEGVLSLSKEPEINLVDVSSNLGVVRTEENEITLAYLMRFNTASKYHEWLARYQALAALLDVRIEETGFYDCWEKTEKSSLEKIYIREYEKLYHGQKPRIAGMHAGVECGFIKKGLGEQAELISIGPNMYDIHTVKERLDLLSVGRTYGLLLKLLAAE